MIMNDSMEVYSFWSEKHETSNHDASEADNGIASKIIYSKFSIPVAQSYK